MRDWGKEEEEEERGGQSGGEGKTQFSGVFIPNWQS